jgi:hypothetical protein
MSSPADPDWPAVSSSRPGGAGNYLWRLEPFFDREQTQPRRDLVRLLVEWKSTPEFGVVKFFDIYVGVQTDTIPNGVVYAADQHSVRGVLDAYTRVQAHA